MLTESKKYIARRTRQLLAAGYCWDGELYPTAASSVRVYFTGPEGAEYQAVYLPEAQRGGGTFKKLLKKSDLPVLTMRECGIESYLMYHSIPYKLAGHHTQWPEYQLVSEFYENKQAKRSKVPYMNHIDEGLGVLYKIGASEWAMRGYCLHPLFQMNTDLANNEVFFEQVNSRSLALAMEYRNIANAYLSSRKISSLEDIALSPLKDVNDMLIADKVQNYKDFLKHHDGEHERSFQLQAYFNNWFRRLGVDYNELSGILDPY